jgi:hypothetical protein
MNTACKIQPNESLWSPLLKVAFRLKNDCRAPLSSTVVEIRKLVVVWEPRVFLHIIKTWRCVLHVDKWMYKTPWTYMQYRFVTYLILTMCLGLWEVVISVENWITKERTVLTDLDLTQVEIKGTQTHFWCCSKNIVTTISLLRCLLFWKPIFHESDLYMFVGGKFVGEWNLL